MCIGSAIIKLHCNKHLLIPKFALKWTSLVIRCVSDSCTMKILLKICNKYNQTRVQLVQTANLDENIAENVQKIQSDMCPITAYAILF
jgi:hypothetical protein